MLARFSKYDFWIPEKFLDRHRYEIFSEKYVWRRGKRKNHNEFPKKLYFFMIFIEKRAHPHSGVPGFLYVFFHPVPKIRDVAHLRGRYLRAQKELGDVRGL